MQGNWIVVGDAARARIFKTGGPSNELQEIHDLTHPESQMHAGDLRTGGKGESIDVATGSTHQSDMQTTTPEKHAERFAKELAGFLKQHRVYDDFTGLILVAEPKVLGRIRDNLDQATAQMVEATIDKNWAQHGRAKIESLLKSRLS